jgi:hypothetical protein
MATKKKVTSKKKQIVNIDYILDASGSMGILVNDVVEGFNTFVRTDAFRKMQEALMTANRSVANDGEGYR